jgi:23S rRNA pseudouridine2605 synthase
MRKSSFGHRPPRGKAQDGGGRSRSGRPDGHGDRKGRPEGADGGKRPFGARVRAAFGGKRAEPQGERPEGASSTAGGKFRKRFAGGGPRHERKERTEDGTRRAGPPAGVRFRERPASPGSRYDRMDRPEWREERGRSEGKTRSGKSGGKAVPSAPPVSEPMRIAKAMARAGLCSRREAERWIADGRVSLNGQVLKTPAIEVTPRDRVLVDGQPLPVLEPTQLWRYHKAKGLVTTHSDPEGRPTVFDNLPPGLPRVISVGRLDFNTEGLILLTNDGELARHLELPATGWLRSYRVRAKGRVTQDDLDRLAQGVEIEGVRYGPVVANVDSAQGANMWITVGIREGKNREVRKVLSSLGLEVNRLIRVSFGPFELGGLKEGEAEPVPRQAIAQALGAELARQLHLVDTDGEKGARKEKAGAPRPRSGGKPRHEGSREERSRDGEPRRDGHPPFGKARSGKPRGKPFGGRGGR